MRIRYRHSIFSALLVVGTILGVSSAPPARAAGQDLFVDTFGDALDYENPQDVTIASNWTMSGVANVSMSGGQLHLDSTGPGWVTLLFPGFEGALPNGREGARNPVNASDYGRLVLRMNTSASQPVAALWHTCVQANASCQGGHFFQSTSGWQTYDVPLTPTPGDPALSIPWAGTVVGLRLLFPSGTGHIDIDWARVVPNGASSVEELHDRPAPRSIDSKLDYATWAGNPWDFDDANDAVQVGNVKSSSISGGLLSACNAGSAGTTSDPFVVLNLPAGQLDADKFHTVAFRYSFDGPFSLEFGNGGGTLARIVWHDSSGKTHESRDIVTYPNLDITTVDLRGTTAVDGARFTGPITQFRFDPNEDSGQRCWKLDQVWLLADPGTDLGPRPGPNAVLAPKAAAPTAALPKVVQKPVVKKPVIKKPITKKPTAKKRAVKKP